MSISRKFALWIVSVLLVAAAVSIYLFYVVEMRAEAKKLELFGKLSGRVIEESLMTFMLNRDNAGLNRKLDEVKAASDTVSRILLLDTSGEVRASSEKGLIGKKFSTRDPGCRECHEKGHKGILMNGNSSYRWAAPVLNKPVCHGCHDSRTLNNGLLIIDFSVSEFVVPRQAGTLRRFCLHRHGPVHYRLDDGFFIGDTRQPQVERHGSQNEGLPGR